MPPSGPIESTLLGAQRLPTQSYPVGQSWLLRHSQVHVPLRQTRGEGQSELNAHTVPVLASISGQTGTWHRLSTHCRPSEQSTDVRHSIWHRLFRQTSGLGHCEL
jgi:hypothetical protein